MTGEKHQFHITLSEKVLSLQAFIHQDLGYPVKAQTLYFNNSKIHKYQWFDSLCIKQGSTIFLEVHIGGGGKRGRDSRDMEQPLFFIPEVDEGDLDIVREILGMKDYDFASLIDNMELSKLLELQKVLETKYSWIMFLFTNIF